VIEEMIGQTLAHYRVTAAIGAGGMGDVYRATDTKLGRDVAIKVLPSELARDPERLARFEREAKLLASLNHPGIAQIYGFESSLPPGGPATHFLAMELVEGEDLAERLKRGAIPVDEAIAIAKQIAEALEEAHEHGIVHRDLKPGNAKLTPDGKVKVLDFGLAKAYAGHSAAGSGPDLSKSPTLAHTGTQAGVILGTAAYMSPEQARGKKVDKRADIWAFGVLLFEMLTGRRAFQGEEISDVLASVLKDAPDFGALPVSVPQPLRKLLARCLERDVKLRLRDIGEARIALQTSSPQDEAAEATSRGAPPVSRRAARSWLPWTVAAIGILLAAASAWLNRGSATAEARWSHFTRITEAAGEETSPTISPDGGTVVYASRVNGSWGLYSQRVGGRNATPVVDDPGRDERGAAFSPDGSLLAFHESSAVGGVFVAGATGESVRRVTAFGFDPAWSPDSRQIAFGTEEINDPASRMSDSTLYVVDVGGGTPRKLVDGDAVQPSWSPSGRRIVYWSNTGGQRDIYTVAAAGGARVAVTDDAAIDWSPVWSPDGRFVYFSSDRGGAMNLWRIAVDESSGRPQGGPEPVTAGVQASAGLPRFSRDGSRLVFQSRVAAVNPVAIPFDPTRERAGTPTVLDTQNNVRIPNDVSPDGKQIAFYNIGEHQEDVFIGSPDGRMRRVTDDAARDRGPMFTADGRSLVFYSTRDGKWALWSVGVDGGNLRRVAGEAAGAVIVTVSPRGDQVAFGAGSGRAVYVAPIGGGPAVELTGTRVDGMYFAPMSWSRDGTRLAGTLATDSGRTAAVGVYDLATHVTTALCTDDPSAVRWLADGRRVVYFAKNGTELVVLDTVTRRRTRVDVRLPAPAALNEEFAVSPDDRTIYYGAARAEADIWIVERSSSTPPGRPR
jgi:serine/threonine protein kinase/Tol biopolymer transport system component